MRTHRIATLLALALAVSAATAQTTARVARTSDGELDSSMRGPTLGFVRDSNALVPLLGVPGAAIMGDALDLGAEVRDAAFSPDRDYVLALLGDSRTAALLALRRDSTARALPDVAAGADRVYLSPEGSAAAFYFVESRRLQIVSGLPENAAVATDVVLAARPRAIAVSDDASSVLLYDAESASIQLLLGDGTTRWIGPASEGSALVFLARSRDALVSDPAENRVYLVRDVSASGETVVIAAERDGLTEPTALAASADGALAFVATARSGIAAIALAGGEMTWTACDCAPTSMSRLSGKSVFRLSEPADGAPMWVYDGSGAEARVVFVPARRSPVVETEGSVQ